MKAATSEATKFSPSPTPTTSGELRRAATTGRARRLSTATRVNAPCSRRQTARIASSRPAPAVDLRGRAGARRPRCRSRTTSDARRPPARRAAAAKFSMMPLWTTATRPSARDVRVGVDVGRRRRGWPSGCGRCRGRRRGSGLRGELRVQVGDLAGLLRHVQRRRRRRRRRRRSRSRGTPGAAGPRRTTPARGLRTDVTDDSAHGAAPYAERCRPGRTAVSVARVARRPAAEPLDSSRVPGATRRTCAARTWSAAVTTGPRWPPSHAPASTPTTLERLRGLGDPTEPARRARGLPAADPAAHPLRRAHRRAAPHDQRLPAAHRAAGRRSSSASPARSRSASRPRPGCCASCSPPGPAPERQPGHHRRLPAPQRRLERRG